jgi:hypothetical protein
MPAAFLSYDNPKALQVLSTYLLGDKTAPYWVKTTALGRTAKSMYLFANSLDLKCPPKARVLKA